MRKKVRQYCPPPPARPRHRLRPRYIRTCITHTHAIHDVVLQMLMGIVDSSVELLNNLEDLVPSLIQLGLRHNAYKVRTDVETLLKYGIYIYVCKEVRLKLTFVSSSRAATHHHRDTGLKSIGLCMGGVFNLSYKFIVLDCELEIGISMVKLEDPRSAGKRVVTFYPIIQHVFFFYGSSVYDIVFMTLWFELSQYDMSF